jgi:ethanolamine-phosphate phospho-lyase
LIIIGYSVENGKAMKIGIDHNTLNQVLADKFQIKGILSAMEGYQDQNYLIESPNGTKHVLKILVNSDDVEFILSQSILLKQLSNRPIGKFLPHPIPNTEGELITEIISDAKSYFARVFPFIEGKFLAEANPSLSFYSELGKVFAKIDHEMIGHDDPVLKCRTHEWDLARVMEILDDIDLIEAPEDRRLVHYFMMRYKEEVLPLYHKLPKGLIHGDGNDWNILISDITEDQVVGVIDFGDMVWGARVNEVAILLAYAMMGRSDFMMVFTEVIRGYQEVTKLSDMELHVLPTLVAARWSQTIVMAFRQEQINPGSAYHQVSLQGAREMLQKWIRINPRALEVKELISPSVGGRYRYFSKAVSLSYSEPIHMIGAAMQYMYSSDGRTYLDCVNNIPHVGHCHPKVVEAGQRQMAKLNTNTRYLFESLDNYAKKLLSKFPVSLNKVFFVNSGSAATDLAIRLAEAHTSCCDYLVLDYAYHGNTKAAIGVSPYKFNRKGGKGKPGNVEILRTYLNDPLIETRIIQETSKGPKTFFAESIVGCAGQIVLPKEFMQRTVQEVRESGGIYVADEVQTGFGRVGHKFWAYELYDVVPDIVILGKPMGNGHPMGAVVCTEEIAASFETGMEFFSSFGGNPVSCEIGLAVLDVIADENLQENARMVGDYLISELQGVFQNSVVRGSGLFLGIELIDKETGNPATYLASSIVNKMKEKGFLLSTDGPFNNVIKFKPPMCFSKDNATELTLALKEVTDSMVDPGHLLIKS